MNHISDGLWYREQLHGLEGFSRNSLYMGLCFLSSLTSYSCTEDLMMDLCGGLLLTTVGRRVLLGTSRDQPCLLFSRSHGFKTLFVLQHSAIEVMKLESGSISKTIVFFGRAVRWGVPTGGPDFRGNMKDGVLQARDLGLVK